MIRSNHSFAGFFRESFVKKVLYAPTSIVFLILTMPTYARAACPGGEEGGITNPLKFCTVQDFIVGALHAMVIVALPILTFFIVYAGFQFIMAQGNQSKLSDAKNNFMYVILGAILILGAWLIASLIGGTISQLTGPAS